MDGQYWKGDRTMSTNEWLLTSDFWQFLEPWHGRWYENEIFIASCTDNIYDLENERWLLGDMIDHVGIYGSGVAEGLSAFSVGLVDYVPIIVSSWNFQELSPGTRVRSMQKVKVRGQRSRSQRSRPKLTVSGLLLQFEFTYDDEMIHIGWCCLGEVPYCFWRSSVKFQGHTALKNVEFDPDWAFPDCNSSLNSPMAMKCCTKLEVA